MPGNSPSMRWMTSGDRKSSMTTCEYGSPDAYSARKLSSLLYKLSYGTRGSASIVACVCWSLTSTGPASRAGARALARSNPRPTPVSIEKPPGRRAISLTLRRPDARHRRTDARSMPDFLMRYARLPACVAALLGLLAGTSGCGLWGSPLDVILVMVDGARAERFGSYGADPTTTPALDAFATDAAIFSYAWSTSCASAPALASALTGKYATSHGATTQDERVPDSVATLAELVADRGYATSAFRSGDAAPAASGAFQGYPVRDVDRAPALTDAALDWLKAVARERPVHALLVYGDLPAASRDADGADAPPTTPRDAAALAERYGTALRTTDEQIGRFLDGL